MVSTLRARSPRKRGTPAVRLRRLRQSADQIRARAEALAARWPGAEVRAGQSVIGGGATPEQSIPTWVIAIECHGVAAVERKLRTGDPAVVARVENDRLILDLRTVRAEEEAELTRALDTCLRPC